MRQHDHFHDNTHERVDILRLEHLQRLDVRQLGRLRFWHAVQLVWCVRSLLEVGRQKLISLSAPSDGVNHASTVETNGRPAIDGLTAVITVSVSQQGSSGTATASGVPAETRYACARASQTAVVKADYPSFLSHSVSDFSAAHPTLRVGHALCVALPAFVTVMVGAGWSFVG